MIIKRKGCRADTKDKRDHSFKRMATRRRALPASADVRRYCPPLTDQGNLGSCVLQSIQFVLRWHANRYGFGPATDHALSVLQLYYDTRAREGTINSDAGCEIRNAIKCLKEIGMGREKDWPYVISKFKQKPPPEVYKMAKLFTALTYERVPITASDVKWAIVEGYPVIIGISLFDSFDSEDVERTGLVPMPGDDESMTGGHAMVIVGFGQKKNCFTTANWWTEKWGDKGYCYIPYSYIGSKDLGSDYWAIKNLGGS